MIQAEKSFNAQSSEESPIKHTEAGMMPDSSIGSQMERRLEADLPLLSDPVVIRNITVFFGALALGIGAGIYFLRRGR